MGEHFESALQNYENMRDEFALQDEAAEDYIDELMVELKPLVDDFRLQYLLSKNNIHSCANALTNDGKAHVLEMLLTNYVSYLSDDIHCIISDDIADKIKLLRDDEQYGTDAMELLETRLQTELMKWE